MVGKKRRPGVEEEGKAVPKGKQRDAVRTVLILMVWVKGGTGDQSSKENKEGAEGFKSG